MCLVLRQAPVLSRLCWRWAGTQTLLIFARLPRWRINLIILPDYIRSWHSMHISLFCTRGERDYHPWTCRGGLIILFHVQGNSISGISYSFVPWLLSFWYTLYPSWRQTGDSESINKKCLSLVKIITSTQIEYTRGLSIQEEYAARSAQKSRPRSYRSSTGDHSMPVRLF